MATLTMRTLDGGTGGTIELDDDTFTAQVNIPLLHQVVTAQLAARRSGTQSTKTRSEVRGGGAKPFRQKGTGRGRQGTTRAPHWAGGGVALGPKPRKYDQKTPKKMIAAALRAALSDRFGDGNIVVVEGGWGMTEPKTKRAVEILDALDLEGKLLIVVDREDEAAVKSFRNLGGIQLVESGELNAYDVLANDVVVFTEATVPAPAGLKRGAAKVDALPDTAGHVVSVLTAEPPAEPADPAAVALPQDPEVLEAEADPATSTTEATTQEGES